MRAAEVRRLAHQARIGPGVPVLDLCCGVGGPGRMITAESGCRYLGVDQSASALATARQLAGELLRVGRLTTESPRLDYASLNSLFSHLVEE